MFTDKRKKPLTASILTTLPLVAVLASSFNANAAENYKLRQSPLGSFGGDIATPADKPGFFGTASLTDLTINGIKDSTGNTLPAPPKANDAIGSVWKSTGKINLTQDQITIRIFSHFTTQIRIM
jgi:hypothetical protein